MIQGNMVLQALVQVIYMIALETEAVFANSILSSLVVDAFLFCWYHHATKVTKYSIP